MSRKLWIVAPCYYDSASLTEVLKRATIAVKSEFPDLEVCSVAIDDSGGVDSEMRTWSDTGRGQVEQTPYNLGHQGALVFGLRKMAPLISEDDYVVTMDSDGEDRPEDLPALIYAIGRCTGRSSVVVAQRTKRSESVAFKILYSCFKIFFSLLTGKLVRNGNFAAYRGWYAKNVLLHPYFDYCYSSSLLALSRQVISVPLSRGQRYFGASKMTTTTLVMHGFRMLLPFSESIAVRSAFAASILLVSALSALIISSLLLAVGHRDALIGVVASGLCFLSAIICLTSSAVFFQIVSQTRALSLRTLTCSASDPQATSFDFKPLASAFDSPLVASAQSSPVAELTQTRNSSGERVMRR